MTFDEANEHKKALKLEVEILKERYQPSGTGSLHTAVHILESRIEEIDGAFMLKAFAEG
jgi:hypothetical protein|tara:strand:+ start:481 stop:657 length:177 start_codon:yes stop_codon:yes gene_type:complete